MATKVKRSYGCAVTAAQELLGSIKTNESWQWANNDIMIGPVVAAQRALDDQLTATDRMFLAVDAADLKKENPEVMMEMCSRFSLNIGPLVKNLEDETATLIRMHAVRASPSAASSKKK